MILEEAEKLIGKEMFTSFGTSSKLEKVRKVDETIIAYLHDGTVCNIDILGVEQKPKNIEVLN